jgi:LysR family transcriptional regulator, low CO2-responsive transcriptional regulator
MRRLTLRQFRVFEAVARNLSFSRAAEELHLSQPAVSMQIKGIETILGLPLTEQLGKKIFLTEAGREVLHASRAITARLDDLQANLAQLQGIDSGRLNLAVTSTVNAVATGILVRFRGRHPGVSIHLGVSNRESVLEQLAANRIDLAIMGQVPHGLELEATRIMDNPLVAIAPPDHRFVQKKKVSLRDLSSEPFLVREAGSGTRAAMTRFFAEKGLELQSSMEMSSNEAIKQAVQAGLGAGHPVAADAGDGTGAEAARGASGRGLSDHAPLVRRASRRQAAVAGGAGVQGVCAQGCKRRRAGGPSKLSRPAQPVTLRPPGNAPDRTGLLPPLGRGVRRWQRLPDPRWQKYCSAPPDRSDPSCASRRAPASSGPEDQLDAIALAGAATRWRTTSSPEASSSLMPSPTTSTYLAFSGIRHGFQHASSK